MSTSKPASGANSTRSPSSTLRTVGPTATTLAQSSRRFSAAVAGMTIPARLLRSPISFVGSARMRSAVIRIDCLTSSAESSSITRRGYRPAPCFQATARRRLDSREDGPRRRHVPDTLVPDKTELAHRVTATVRAYVLLTKPRVIELLLVTTVPAMVLAEG